MNPEKASKCLKYDTSRGVYEIVQNLDVIATLQVDSERIRLFETERYDQLFDDFREETDVVDKVQYGDQVYFRHRRLVEKHQVDTEISPGLYGFRNLNLSVGLAPMSAPTQDQFVELNHPVEELDTDIVQFFNQREAYQELGIAHRRGSLVYGPPGNGKTFTILRIVQRLAEEKDCLAFYIPSSIGYQLEELNNFEPVFRDQPTILILEEITDHAQDRREMLLSLLDGEQSWTHNYVIATTNYPDRLPANIVDRPGRFDRLLEVSMPDGQQRRDYLEFHLPQSTVDRVLVEKTEGFSLAYLKELVLRSQLRSDNPLEVVKQFKQQKQKMSQAFDCPDGQLGFSVNGDSSV